MTTTRSHALGCQSIGLALCVALTLQVIARAAEPPAPPAPPAADGAETPGVEKANATDLKPPNFVFNPNNRRDPFAFRLKYPELPKIETPNNPLTPTPVDAEAKQKLLTAHNLYNESEKLFMDMELGDALGKCTAGLQILKELTDHSANLEKADLDLRENLFRLSKACQRLKERQDAERDFRALNLKLTGVVAREKNSQVLVNSKVLGRGGVVPINDSAEVVIYDIQPSEVIFLFRDYKMKLSISEGNERDSGQK